MKILLVLLLGIIALAIYKMLTGSHLRASLARRLAPELCRRIGHRRSGATVRRDGDVYLARCRRCGVRLTRTARDQPWTTRDADGPEASMVTEPAVAPRDPERVI